MRLLLVTLLASALLSGCASNRAPSGADNICDVFDQKRGWYKDARRSERRWGSEIPVLMAIMYQESTFRPRAKPPRTRILGFIPGPRPSSAYGFAQVKTETWAEYQRMSGNHWASRSNFADAIDFVGWYNEQSNQRVGIDKNNARNLYLAYHEGHAGFRNRSYDSKQWLVGVAGQVDKRADDYRRQLRGCERRFKGPWWWPLR